MKIDMARPRKQFISALGILATIATILVGAEPAYNLAQSFFSVTESPKKIEELRTETRQSFKEQNENLKKIEGAQAEMNQTLSKMAQKFDDFSKEYQGLPVGFFKDNTNLNLMVQQ